MNLNYHKVKQNNLVDYSLAWQDHFFLLCLGKGKRTIQTNAKEKWCGLHGHVKLDSEVDC